MQSSPRSSANVKHLSQRMSYNMFCQCPLHSMVPKQSQTSPSLCTLLSLNWNIVIIPLAQGGLAVIARQMMWKSNKKPLPRDSSSWPSDTDHEGYELPMRLWRVIQVAAQHYLRATDLHCLKGIWLNKWQHMVDERAQASGEREMWHCFQRERKHGCSCDGGGGGGGEVCVSPPLFNLSLCCHTLAACFQ